MIFNVRGLDEALKAVKEKFSSMLDGNNLGKSPMIPKKVAPTMVRAEANQALKKCCVEIKSRVAKRATTVTRMTRKRAGVLK